MNDETMRNMRSGLIDVLELIASERLQRECQLATPSVGVPSELFNLWDDFYLPDGEHLRPVMSEDEFAAMQAFGSVLAETGAGLPRILPPLDEFMRTEAWHRPWAGARIALRAFGKEPE